MTTSPTTPCPACGAKGCRAASAWSPHERPRRVALGPCAGCGWRRHDSADPRTDPRKWSAVEHLPRPPAMPDAEFRFRATMFLAWRAEPASGLRRHFEVFADFLRERESAEEIAARADWLPYAAKQRDPKGWWQWTVPAGPRWVELKREKVWHEARWTESGDYTPAGHFWETAIDDSRAKLSRSYHNGRWWLCWPPGMVRVTGPLSHDPQRWRVTVQVARNLSASRPVERVWPGGYTQLLCDYVPGAPKLVVDRGAVREPGDRHEDLGLFREEPTDE